MTRISKYVTFAPAAALLTRFPSASSQKEVHGLAELKETGLQELPSPEQTRTAGQGERWWYPQEVRARIASDGGDPLPASKIGNTGSTHGETAVITPAANPIASIDVPVGGRLAGHVVDQTHGMTSRCTSKLVR